MATMGNSTRADGEASRLTDEITERLVKKAMRSLGLIMPTTGETARFSEEEERRRGGGTSVPGDHEAWPTVLHETPEPVVPLRPATVPRIVKISPPLSLEPNCSFAFMSFRRTWAESEKQTHLDPADCVARRFGAAGFGVVRPFYTSRQYTELGDPLEVGRRMSVDYVFDGSIDSAGSRLRATARLLRVRDGVPMWEGTCEGDKDDLIDFENSVAEQVALIFEPRPTPEQLARFVKRPTRNADAYFQYKLGRDRFNQFNEEGLNDAIGYFRQAAALDPDFADAYACLGETLIWLTLLGQHSPGIEPAQVFDEARRCTDKALALNPELASAHAAEAFINMCVEADTGAAERGFCRAIEYDPNYVLGYVGLACLLTGQGRFAQALAKMEVALTIDPTSFICHFIKGTILYESRDYSGAVRQFEDTLGLREHFVKQFRNGSQALLPPDTIFYGLALAYAALGRYKEAGRAATRATRYARGNPIKLALRAYVLAVAGRPEEAKTILEQLLRARQQDFIPFHIALIHAALSDKNEATSRQHKDAALQYLRSALDKCDYWMFLLRVDPRLDNLRSDEGFDTLLRE